MSCATCFRRKYNFSLWGNLLHFPLKFFFLNQTNSVIYKSAGWFCELLKTLLIFCLFSCTELANTSSISSILDKKWWKNALRPRMIVQCHWWHIELQSKFVFISPEFYFLNGCLWPSVLFLTEWEKSFSPNLFCSSFLPSKFFSNSTDCCPFHRDSKKS